MRKNYYVKKLRKEDPKERIKATVIIGPQKKIKNIMTSFRKIYIYSKLNIRKELLSELMFRWAIELKLGHPFSVTIIIRKWWEGMTALTIYITSYKVEKIHQSSKKKSLKSK